MNYFSFLWLFFPQSLKNGDKHSAINLIRPSSVIFAFIIDSPRRHRYVIFDLQKAAHDFQTC